MASRSMEGDTDLDMLDVFPPLPGPSRHPNDSMCQNSKVLTFINNTIEDINDALCAWPHGEVSIVLKRINANGGSSKTASIDHHQTSENARVKVSCRQTKYSWPGNTADEAWRFSMTPPRKFQWNPHFPRQLFSGSLPAHEPSLLTYNAACILAILHEINNAILANVTVTKRYAFSLGTPSLHHD